MLRLIRKDFKRCYEYLCFVCREWGSRNICTALYNTPLNLKQLQFLLWRKPSDLFCKQFYAYLLAMWLDCPREEIIASYCISPLSVAMIKYIKNYILSKQFKGKTEFIRAYGSREMSQWWQSGDWKQAVAIMALIGRWELTSLQA